VPRDDEIGSLADLYGADRATRRQLAQAARDLRDTPAPVRAVITRGAWRMQRRIAGVEAASARLRVFHGMLVPGLAQTPAYARQVLAAGGDITGADLDRSVTERIARQAVLNSERDITILLIEGALRWQAASPVVMAEQLAHLDEIADRPRVRVGIIGWTTPARVFPLHGFSVYDSRMVIVGTRAGTAFLTDAQDVADHEKLFAELEALADFGAEAQKHISRIGGEYRSLRDGGNR
jgi:Domain of unknown function (DUF5753)